MNKLSAPMPWFGGKSRASALIWSRFGRVRNFVEPFAGSLAVLLGRPEPITGPETVNDLDGLLVNFWRAVRVFPQEVAEFADWPVAELDLHARHAVLVEKRCALSERLQADPEYCDAKLAGWWCWGACAWIGSGWCSGAGPWRRELTEGGWRLVNVNDRQLPHLGNAGKGEWLAALAHRLRPVRIACGDWSRVTGPSVTTKHGLTAVLLDPPYNSEDAGNDVYGVAHSEVAEEVRAWCVANGNDPILRIALCGYAEDHAELIAHGWSTDQWTARKGYQIDGENSARETIWFSPHCLGIERQHVLAL